MGYTDIMEENTDPDEVESTETSTGDEPVPEVTADIDPDDDWATALQSTAELVAKRELQRPDISWMEDAIDWDTPDELPRFLPKKGDYVVIERYITTMPGKPWLDTRVYLMKEDAGADGSLRLSDPVRQQQAMSNWKRGVIEGFSFKAPPKGRNPETIFESTGKVRRKRKPVENAPPTVLPTGEKRKRGRPKGSKNRDKDTIQAEKAARRDDARRAKKTKRK